MILAFSTSSPWTSVALMSAGGEVLKSERRLKPMRSSEACMELLESLEVELGQVELFLADLGPGSFSGVRVGVTIAKTLAFAAGKQAAGCSSFDLIAVDKTVAIPSRRNEYLVRIPGQPAYETRELPTGKSIPNTQHPIPNTQHSICGYGAWFEDQETYPEASSFWRLLALIKPVRAEALVPEYVLEPSISQPKKPYAEGALG